MGLQPYMWDAAAHPAHISLGLFLMWMLLPFKTPLSVPHPPAESPAKGLPRSYLFTEDLLALGIVDPCRPAPISEAFPVAIV